MFEEHRPIVQSESKFHKMLFLKCISLILDIFLFFLQFLYSLFQLLPSQNRALIVSRQGNKPSIDLLLLCSEIENREIPVKVKILSRKIDSSFLGYFMYFFHLLRQLFFMATSKYLITDSFNIPLSALKHKASLLKTQIWHAQGAFKFFGLSTIGSSGSFRALVASKLKIHQGYDFVVTSSKKSIKSFSEALGTPTDKIVVCPLPRTDLLTDSKWIQRTRRKVFEHFPELKGQKIALWAPTLEKQVTLEQAQNVFQTLSSAISETGYVLVNAPHPLSDKRNVKVVNPSQITTTEWLTVSDFVVTDHSSIIFEASVLGLGVFIYSSVDQLNKIRNSSYLDNSIIEELAITDAYELSSRISKGDLNLTVSRKLFTDYIEIPKFKTCVQEIATIAVPVEEISSTLENPIIQNFENRSTFNIGIVAVSFNSNGVLENFLESCTGFSGGNSEVIIVDNGTKDIETTRKICKSFSVQLIEMAENQGYGTALNIGVKNLSPDIEHIVLSNPDVIFCDDALHTLCNALTSEKNVGLVGPAIYEPNGNLYPSARSFPSFRNGIGHVLFSTFWPTNPWSLNYKKDYKFQRSNTNVDWVSGACIGISRELFNRVEGFDDEFFMYFEDVDLGKRVSNLGLNNLFVPSAQVTHIGAHSTSTYKSEMKKHHHKSAIKYIQKNFPDKGVISLKTLTILAIRIREKLM